MYTTIEYILYENKNEVIHEKLFNGKELGGELDEKQQVFNHFTHVYTGISNKRLHGRSWPERRD